jgi:peptidoglycan-associated lipoprotein
MRFTSASKIVVSLLASIALLTACQTAVPLKDKAPVEEKVVVAPKEVKKEPEIVKVVAKEVDELNIPGGVLSKRSVYFDYDKYDIKDEFKSLVSAHAAYLVKNKARKILVQGNTDERGGREYNIALGQKRAEAVRKAMALLGVAESQIEAVSLGKEKPKATGSDEASWAENRRSDIVYQ